MPTLKQQIKNQRYWMRLEESEKDFGDACRGDYFYKYNSWLYCWERVGVILGSVYFNKDGRRIGAYLYKTGKKAEIDSKHTVLVIEAKNFKKEYKISLKSKLRKL